MNQPIDYILDADHRLIYCHCREGFICPNTCQAVVGQNRCRILVRKPPRRHLTWPARLFVAAWSIAVLASVGYLIYLLA